MIKLTQLEITNENIGKLLTSNDVYLIRFKEETTVKLNFIKGCKEIVTYLDKLTLVNVRTLSAKEMRKILKTEEVAIVKVTMGES